MTQEDKDLLLKDLCARLPYGVKILHIGWDCDRDTDFETVETLIGIDDRFIYTVWDRTGAKEKHCLSVSNWLSYLRPMSSMTEEEKSELLNFLFDKESKYFYIGEEGFIDGKASDLMKEGLTYPSFCPINIVTYMDWLNNHHFDYRGLIGKGLALEAPKDMYK